MAWEILGADGLTVLKVDSGSNAARTTLYDQYGNPMSDVSSLGNVLNALNGAVTLTLGGQGSIGINIGATAGTITATFEATIDSSTWFSISGVPVGGGASVSSTSANGQWVASVAGFFAVRVRISAITGGASMTTSVVITPSNSTLVPESISGTVTANQGTPNTKANAWPIEITDGTNGPTAVKAASTAAVATDPAVVVAVSPNNSVAITAAALPLPAGAATSANQTNGAQETQIVQGGNTATVTAASALKVDGSAVTQPISAVALPLPIGAATSANQTTIGSQTTELNDGTHTGTIKAASTAAIATDTALVVAVSPNNSVAVTAAALPLPAGAATSANQTNGAQETQIVQGGNTATVTVASALKVDGSAVTQPVSGTVTANQGTAALLAAAWPVEITDGTNVLGTNAHPVIIDPVQDTQPATQNITAQDVASTSTGEANGQNFITGAATAGSTTSFACQTDETVKVMVTGAWTGTLTVEISLDGGTTWTASDVHQTGTAYTTNNFTANFIGGLNVSGCTNFRIRATAAWTGTATVKVVISDQVNTVYVGSALALRDGVTQSTLDTIKAASTQSAATDTAIVVALSPASAQTRASTPNVTGVASSAASQTILAANTARLGAIIVNSSTSILYLRYGSTAASIANGGYTVQVAISGGVHELPFGYTGQITGIWAAANGFANITELTV
jgi:hypothetical protein